MLGNRILKFRKIKNLSQEDLAKELGVTRQTISKWELNETIPDINIANKMAKIFGITLDELVGNETKDILLQKVSNTETLAGMIIKILNFIKYVLIFILTIVIIFTILGIIGYFFVESYYGDEMTCSLDNTNYKYGVMYSTKTGKIEQNYSDEYIKTIVDTSNYQYAKDLKNAVEDYFTSSGGECTTN